MTFSKTGARRMCPLFSASTGASSDVGPTKDGHLDFDAVAAKLAGFTLEGVQ